MILIGLAGPAGTGKTTAADHLVRTRDAVAVSIAEPLYEILAICLNMTTEAVAHAAEDREWKEAPHPLLKGKSPRRMLQSIGDSLRNQLGDLFLIKHLEYRIADLENLIGDQRQMIVITDIRRNIEADWVRRHRGHVVHLHRKTAGGAAHHHTENRPKASYKDLAVQNNGCIEDLNQQLDIVISQILVGASAA